MTDSKERRQAIYDKIKESSKNEFILSEMKRLGFWSDENVDFGAVTKFFKDEGELSKKIQEKLRDKNILDNPEVFIAQKHKERKLASKQRQKETKEKREKVRQEKAAKWQESKKSDIIYLGDQYSHQLNQKLSLVERLKSQGLPVIQTAAELAKNMGVSVGELRFLTYSRKNSKISHYKRFKVPKKSGGYRLISAPMPRLKQAQTWILEEVLNKVKVHESAHGCVTGKSIKTNAEPHVAKAVVINQDVKNFFPSITYNRIKGVFLSLGYSHQVAVIFALLCSEPKIVDIDLLGEDYFAQKGERFLPQGSPCSPAITNILCRRLDFRLTGLAKKYNLSYTRYVDDLTFSSTEYPDHSVVTKVLKYSRLIVKDENFRLHPDKLRVMKKGARQEVTGVVVNEKPNVSKKTLKRFRALLFQIEKDGIEGKQWNRPGNVLAQIDGFANFIYQINPEKGARYKAQVAVILVTHNYKELHKKAFPPKSNPTNETPQNRLWSRVKSFFKKN
ncbi:MAG: RNA-directed DNA polymerase [Crocinitomix sp.]|nr:RNA-directed DNA polymerase [Crocinitomix sp.]